MIKNIIKLIIFIIILVIIYNIYYITQERMTTLKNKSNKLDIEEIIII